MPDIVKTPGKRRGHNAKTEKESEDKDSEEKPKPKCDKSKVKCFNCGNKGHIAPNCPEKDQEEEEQETKKKIVTWEDEQYDEDAAEMGMCVTYEVYESVRSPP
jgi:6-phosphogluconolactonase/glucosamine-6-phosphate isomerase/deaminase